MLSKRIEVDLVLINILTLVLVLAILTSSVPWLRVILGFPFVLFFPGYVFIAVLFPQKEKLKAITRAALSLGLSMSIVIFLGLILHFTPPGIKLHSILLSNSLFILFVSGLAWYARWRIGAEERFRVSPRLSIANLGYSLRAGGKGYFSLVIILLCVMLGGSGALACVMTKPAPKPAFTEFYILGIEGKAEDYPLELHPGEKGEVMVGIVNHELDEKAYRLEVLVDEVQSYELYPIQLKPEEKWESMVGFTVRGASGRQKVEFRLYRANEPTGDIRYLWVDVRT